MEDPTTQATPVLNPETIVGIIIVCCALTLGLVLLICVCAKKVLSYSRSVESDTPGTANIGTEPVQYNRGDPPPYSKSEINWDIYYESIGNKSKRSHIEMTNPLSYTSDYEETNVTISEKSENPSKPQACPTVVSQESENRNNFSEKTVGAFGKTMAE